MRKMLVPFVAGAMMWPAMASAAWQRASSAHFIVYADDSPGRVRDFTQKLERFDSALRLLARIPDEPLADAERVRVYMVDDIDDVQRLAGKSLGHVAGFYESRVGGPVAFVPRNAPNGTAYDLNAQEILFHEYTHHFMFMNWPSAVFPVWFVEGFAEFNATATLKPDGSVQIGQAPGYRAGAAVDDGAMPASRLIKLDPGKMNERETAALYGRGWLLTHMLTFDPDRAGQLAAYMKAINAGTSAEQASAVFGKPSQLDNDMNRYANHSLITVANLAASKLKTGAITIRALSAGEAAVMPALLRSTRGVDARQAPDVAKLAARLAERYPNDAGAQNELAEAEFDARDLDAADAAADRAIAADPKSLHALIYKGHVAVARLMKANDTDPAHWRAARHWFVMANHLDPDNPLALTLFYTSFVAGHQKPTVNSEDGMLAAYRVAPFDEGLRMTAASIYLHRGDKEQARLALAPVAYSPHRADLSPAALSALQALDDDDVAKAETILDHPPSAQGHDDSKPT